MANEQNWTNQWFIPGGIPWTENVQVDANSKVSAANITQIRNVIATMNGHSHSWLYSSLPKISTDNPTMGAITWTDDPLIIDDKVKSDHIKELRTWIEWMNVYGSSQNHKHKYNDGGSGATDGWATLLMRGKDNLQQAFYQTWVNSMIDFSKKVKAEDLNELRLACEQINGHRHYICVCNCNHSPCHSSCHSSCHGSCNRGGCA